MSGYEWAIVRVDGRQWGQQEEMFCIVKTFSGLLKCINKYNAPLKPMEAIHVHRPPPQKKIAVMP